jgi:CheY-like chemotaxis protein
MSAGTIARVLIVDDTPLNLKLLGDLLQAKGYAVTTANNGEEALAKLAADASSRSGPTSCCST